MSYKCEYALESMTSFKDQLDAIEMAITIASAIPTIDH